MQQSKPTFKHTEIGWIPEDWDIINIGSVTEIHSGATPDTNNPDYWNGEIYWCTPTDITNTKGKYLLFTERKITQKGLKSCSATLLPKGALLLCSRATIGEMRIALTEVCTNQGFKSIVCKGNISNEFLYYYLLTIKNQFLSKANGSTFLEISKKDVANTKLPLPPLSEQHAIANVLSDVDKFIETLDDLIEKKQAIKKATMHLLLTGKKRLPGFDTSNKFKKTEIGWIPEDWEVNKLGLICNFYDNFRIPVEESKRESGSIPYYGANGILSYVNGYTHDGEFVLFAEDGASDLKDYPIFYSKGKIWVNNHAHVISGVKNKADTKYVSYALKQANFTKLLVGGTRAKLNGSLAREIKIFIPNSIQEQHAIAQVLSDMDSEIEALQARRDKLKQIKQGMMQVLLTGKIRLIEPKEEGK